MITEAHKGRVNEKDQIPRPSGGELNEEARCLSRSKDCNGPKAERARELVSGSRWRGYKQVGPDLGALLATASSFHNVGHLLQTCNLHFCLIYFSSPPKKMHRAFMHLLLRSTPSI